MPAQSSFLAPRRQAGRNHSASGAPFLNQPAVSPDLQNAKLCDVVDSYLRYYAAGRGHTARAKHLDLRHFLSFLAVFRGYSSPNKLRVRDWDFSAVQRFVDESIDKGAAPATVARRLATLKHMGRSLSEKVAGFVNPAREVKSPRIQAPKPKALTKQQIQATRRRAAQRKQAKDSFIRLRNESLFTFLLDTGIRADEIRNIKRAQLDENLEWIKNVRTKGRRFRNVYITSAARPQLKRYLEARKQELKRFFRKLSHKHDGVLPLFISSYAAKPDKLESFMMGAKTIWRAVNELSPQVHLHPHLLRHSYALNLLKHCSDIRLVSQALGHSDVKVTMRYTERKDEEVARALEKAASKAQKTAKHTK